MKTNLSKSHVQEIPLSSGVGPFLHTLQGDLALVTWSTSSPSSFLSHLSACKAVFHTFPHLIPWRLQFLPFLDCVFPWGLPRGCAVPTPLAAAEPSRFRGVKCALIFLAKVGLQAVSYHWFLIYYYFLLNLNNLLVCFSINPSSWSNLWLKKRKRNEKCM